MCILNKIVKKCLGIPSKNQYSRLRTPCKIFEQNCAYISFWGLFKFPPGYSLNFLIWVYIILFWLAPNSKWEALNIKLEEQNIFETAQGIAIVSKFLLQASYKRPDYLF
jgi:hypothetical protein